MIRISEYLTTEGWSPFSDWLEKLPDRRSRARIRTRIDRVSLGNFGDCKSVGEGIMELRLTYGPGYRIYFGREGDTVVILLCGDDKASQSKDIKTTKRYWRDYLDRDDG